MARAFRFSILDVIILTLFLGVFVVGNFRPQEVRVAGNTHRLQAMGFPIGWVWFKPPADDYVVSTAWKKWYVIFFNGVFCLGMALGSSIVVKRLRSWIDQSKAPESNPAKLLLYPIGVLAILLAIVNLFATKTLGQVGTCIAILAIGVLAVSLAYRTYDRLNRWATILWGSATALVLFYACLIVDPIGFPPSRHDYPGITIVTLLLAALIAVIWLASKKRAVHVQSLRAA